MMHDDGADACARERACACDVTIDGKAFKSLVTAFTRSYFSPDHIIQVLAT
jgi:hypothetical protein